MALDHRVSPLKLRSSGWHPAPAQGLRLKGSCFVGQGIPGRGVGHACYRTKCLNTSTVSTIKTACPAGSSPNKPEP